MKMLKILFGFFFFVFVLVVVVLGILAAVATVQFGTIITDAKVAAVDGAKGPFAAQLALSINTLKALPTLAQFGTNVHAMTTLSGGVFKGAWTPGAGTGTFTINTGNALCAAADGNYTTTGTYTAATGALTFSNTVAS